MAGYLKRAEQYLSNTCLFDDPEQRDAFESNFWTCWENTCKIAARLEAIHLKHRIEAGVVPKDSKIATSEPGTKDKWFFITIRPNKRSFQEFKKRIEDRIIKRSFVKEFTYCFEQKGTTNETLGTGFHLHGIMRVPHYTSPGNLARDILSSLNGFCGNAGVKCQLSKNPNEHFERYCKNYESEDGHKAVTKEWDEKWRIQEGIQAIYTPSNQERVEGVSVEHSGPEQVVSDEPIIVSFT